MNTLNSPAQSGTTNTPFSGDSFTQHSSNRVLSPEMAIERYTIHWLIKHFGLIGDGQDGTDCPHPTDTNLEINIHKGGKYFYDPYTASGGGTWKFYGDNCADIKDEAMAFKSYMDLCQEMYRNPLLPLPQLQLLQERVEVSWVRETRRPSINDLDHFRSFHRGFITIEALKYLAANGQIKMVNYPARDGKLHKCFAIGRSDDTSIELTRYDGNKLWDTDPNSTDNRTLALEISNARPVSTPRNPIGNPHLMLVAGADDYLAATTAKLNEGSDAHVICMLNTMYELPPEELRLFWEPKVTIYTGACSQYRDAGERWLEQLRDFGIDAEIFQQQGDQTLVEYAASGAAICPDTIAKEVA